MHLRDIGESGLIEKIRQMALSKDRQLRIPIGDDAALFQGLDSVLVTCDLLIEDVHFVRAFHPPRLLGRKSLSVNLSDIAAMAGIPRYALLAIGLPPETRPEDIDRFLQGFFEVAAEYGVTVIGGDTSAARQWIVSVTVIGEAPQGRAVARSGAKSGDMIFVSGTAGDSALGLSILQKLDHPLSEETLMHQEHQWLLLRHLDPTPRISLGRRLSGPANSMIDLSDGLVTDLGHIIEESGKLRAEVRVNALPLSPQFRSYFRLRGAPQNEALKMAAGGGEDYELLFTVSPDKAKEVLAIADEEKIQLTAIGTVRESDSPGMEFLDAEGKPLPEVRTMYSHFGE